MVCNINIIIAILQQDGFELFCSHIYNNVRAKDIAYIRLIENKET